MDRIIPVDFTRKAVIKQISEAIGHRIPDATFYSWIKKDFIFPSSYITRGKRLMPVFYLSDLDKIIAKVLKLNKQGLIRLNLDDKKVTKKKKN